jgi:hypothetical protein
MGKDQSRQEMSKPSPQTGVYNHDRITGEMEILRQESSFDTD